MKSRGLSLRRVGAIVLLLVVCAAVSPAAASAGPGRHRNLHPLWSTFPLGKKSRGTQVDAPKKTHPRPAHQQSTSGHDDLWALVVVASAASVVFLVGAVAGVGRRRSAESSHSRDAAPALGGQMVHTPQGGRTMNRPSQKSWFKRESEPAGRAPAPASDSEGTDRPTKRIAAYANVNTGEEAGNAEQNAVAESTPLSSRSAGEEVDAILQIARESAAKLTKAAADEAERTRAEANEAATRELEQARSRAETEREEAAKAHAEAEAHATQIRSEAETAAKKLRAETESHAASLVEAAHAKVAAADAEVEQKIRAAEESVRARLAALKGEARRHEERLDHLLDVLRAMTSQVEAVLEGENEGARNGELAGQGHVVELADEDLGQVLRPNTQSEPVA